MDNNIINQVISQNQNWIDETWEKIEKKLKRVSVEAKDKIPKESINGVYDDMSNAPGAWTNGFWPGIMWLMYDATGEDCFKIAAENVEEKLDAAEKEHAKEIDGWEVEAENWKQENVRLEKERDDEKKAAKQAAADHKADMERLKADHEKEMATLRESLKKQAKAQTAGADPSVVRVQIALENFRREVRTVAQVLNLLREDGDEKKAVMLQAQVERTVGAIIAETGWTL